MSETAALAIVEVDALPETRNAFATPRRQAACGCAQSGKAHARVPARRWTLTSKALRAARVP